MLARRTCAPVSIAAPRATQVRAFHARGPARAAEGVARTPLPSAGIKLLGVVGAGQMGMGIAQVAAQVAKVDVLVMDANKANLDKSLAFMDTLMKKNVAKGKMTEQEREDVKKRVKPVTQIADFANVDFVIEAVSENTALKQAIFKDLNKVTRPEAILATNTSSISITKIAAATTRPEKVIGMHFSPNYSPQMNPVPVMKLVEIIPGLATSQDTLDRTLNLSHAMGKTTAKAADMPGFIANRLLMPYINEAAQALLEGVGSVADIDTTMKLGTNVPMGPLELADFIGLDTCLAIMRVLHNELGDSKYRPSPLLIKYVDAGWLGKKSGRGFYHYSSGNKA